MAIDFPSTNLTPGQIHTAAGVSWKWDGTTWQASAVGGSNNNAVTNFTELSDTPGTLSAGKWLKVNVGGNALIWTDAPAASAVGQYSNTSTIPATHTNTATFSFAQDSGALYYSDGLSLIHI